jgi:hypothetical protein
LSERTIKCVIRFERFVENFRGPMELLERTKLCLVGKDIVFRFILEYSRLRDFGPKVIDLFLYEDF